MNKLPAERRAQILQMMAEGVSIRSITRLTGVSKNTVTKLIVDAGQAFWAYQDAQFRDLQCRRIQVDEIWSFVYAKQKNVPEHKRGEAGDIWTWTAIDAETKLVPAWYIGSRDGAAAMDFMDDLAGRLANRVQLTSDGHRAYLEAVEGAFGGDIDYAMLVKLYGEEPNRGPERKYSPSVCVGASKRRIEGDPDPAHVSTSHAERQNLSMRMGMRRFTRLTNGFSKKVENHIHAIAIYFMHYNFVRIHSSLKVTPAMAAGVTDRLFEMSDLVAILDEWEGAPKKRGPYKRAVKEAV